MLALSKYEPGNANEHFTLSIGSPWSQRRFCKLQYPEWAYVALSEFCLLGYTGERASHLRPEEFPALAVSEDGRRASYALDYPTGVRFAARVDLVGDDTVEMELKTINGADAYFPGIDFMPCFLLVGMGEEFSSIDHSLKLFQSTDGLLTFDDLHHGEGRPLTEAEKESYRVKIPVENTVGTYGPRWLNGVWGASEMPVRETAALPFIARKSAGADRYIAVFWPRARYIFSNSELACLHADVTVPNCPAGEEVSLHGRIVFHEGDVDSLVTRVGKELEELSGKDNVWAEWHE